MAGGGHGSACRCDGAPVYPKQAFSTQGDALAFCPICCSRAGHSPTTRQAPWRRLRSRSRILRRGFGPPAPGTCCTTYCPCGTCGEYTPRQHLRLSGKSRQYSRLRRKPPGCQGCIHGVDTVRIRRVYGETPMGTATGFPANNSFASGRSSCRTQGKRYSELRMAQHLQSLNL